MRFVLPNGPVTLNPFALHSAEREQNEEKRIKNGMDVDTPNTIVLGRARTGWRSGTSNMFKIRCRSTRAK